MRERIRGAVHDKFSATLSRPQPEISELLNFSSTPSTSLTNFENRETRRHLCLHVKPNGPKTQIYPIDILALEKDEIRFGLLTLKQHIMGRINLTALRVRKQALANLQGHKTNVRPVWVEVTGDIPPSQTLIRQQPHEHPVAQIRADPINGQIDIGSKRQRRKPSRLFAPLPIRYEEDELRHQFYSDHPWELARPRVVLETSGDSHARADWSRGLLQNGIPLSGESVVQRQLFLLQTVPGMTTDRAYDVARKEFYDLRRQEDVQRRISAEEARATGANFGKSVLHWSMEVENKQYNDWEAWSRSQILENVQKSAAFAGEAPPSAEEEALTTANPRDAIGANSFAREEEWKADKKGRGVLE